MNDDLISREALKKHKVYSEERHEYVVPVYNIDNAPTVEPYQGEECVNIKMSEEEIKQFKQMLREHNLLYSTTSNTFVEVASVERPTGHWIDDNGADSYYANCSCCGYQIDTHYECGYLNFCPNCGADMRGGRE